MTIIQTYRCTCDKCGYQFGALRMPSTNTFGTRDAKDVETEWDLYNRELHCLDCGCLELRLEKITPDELQEQGLRLG